MGNDRLVDALLRQEDEDRAQCDRAARALSATPKNASPFGLVVAGILDDIWALYNLKLTRVDFSLEWIVEVNMDRSLSTFDGDALTQLLVRCHDACIRLTVAPCNFRYLTLQFHPRQRAGDFSKRHPSIEQAVERVRARNYFGATPRPAVELSTECEKRPPQERLG